MGSSIRRVLPRLVLVLAAVSSLTAGPSSQDELSDRELRKIWKGLSQGQRTEAIEWFRFECTELATRQARLIRALVVAHGAPDRTALPSPVVYFRAEDHTPKTRKKRKLLDVKSSKARAARRKFVPDSEESAARWGYEWSTRRVVFLGADEDEDPEAEEERVLEMAIAGVHPDLDLARALCLRALDGGDETHTFAAFAHAYADRRGNVFPEVTLYDAWASGERMEMPDIDPLGLLHTIRGSHGGFRSPISTKDQKRLYATVEELFVPARRYRELREALTDTFFAAQPTGRENYVDLDVPLHGLWLGVEEDPTRLGAALPRASEWSTFLEHAAGLGARDRDGWSRAALRRDELAGSAEAVRALCVYVLRGMGEGD